MGSFALAGSVWRTVDRANLVLICCDSLKRPHLAIGAVVGYGGGKIAKSLAFGVLVSRV